MHLCPAAGYLALKKSHNLQMCTLPTCSGILGDGINDRIATQIYLTPEIPIGSPVMSRTTSEPSDGRSRRWLLTLLDAAVFVHFAIVIPALHSRLSDRNQIWHTYSDGYGTDSNLNIFDPPDPRRGARGDFRGSKIQKSGKCHELPRKSIIFFVKPHPTPGGPNGDFRGSKIQKSGKCHGLPRKSIIFVNPHPTLRLGVLGLKLSKSLRNSINCRENCLILNP